MNSIPISATATRRPRGGWARAELPAWIRDLFSAEPRNTRLIDTVTALVLMITIGFPFQFRPDWSTVFSWHAVPVWCLFTVAVAVRRSAVWTSLALVAAGLVLKWILGLPPHGMDVAIPVVLFTAAARGTRAQFAVAGACALIWPSIQAVYAAFFEMELPFLNRVTGLALLGVTEFLLPVGLIGVPLILVNLLVWGAGGMLRVQLTSSRLQHAAQLAELEYLQTQEELVREQERNYIARDMHDIVAHSLAVIVAQADGGRYLMKSSPNAVGPVLSTISETARDALVDVRGLLGRLRHSQSDAVQKTLHDLPAVYDRVRQAGMNLQTVTLGSRKSLSRAGEVAVFRMVQECLTNALKYGNMQEPVVVRKAWGDALYIEIQNRVADDEGPSVGGSGHGLIGMRERLLVVGGELSYGAEDGLWTVRARVPLQSDSPTTAAPGVPHQSASALSGPRRTI